MLDVIPKVNFVSLKDSVLNYYSVGKLNPADSHATKQHQI